MFARALLTCPYCGNELRFFESFPRQSGLSAVDVFTFPLIKGDKSVVAGGGDEPPASAGAESAKWRNPPSTAYRMARPNPPRSDPPRPEPPSPACFPTAVGCICG